MSIVGHAMHTEPIDDRSVWTGRDLAADRSWEFELSDAHRSELDAALGAVNRIGLHMARIRRHHFALPTLSGLLIQVGAEIQRGRGFALLRGLPVEDYDLEDLEKLYWGLCTHLGTGITQNSDATLIHYVTDGVLRPNQGTRGVGSPLRSSLHVDLTDYASLLCVRQAPDNPGSWVASSMAVHNELLARHPDSLAVLYEGFEWDRLDEHGPAETATTGYRVPVFSEAGGVVSCRYNRYWMARAIRRNNDQLPDETRQLFDRFDEIADRIRFEVEFRPGDIQFINNYVALHGRDEHGLVDDEHRKRLLMRIWLDADVAQPVADEAIVRYGIVRHGALGWSVDQYCAGLHRGAHERNVDGLPVVSTRD